MDKKYCVYLHKDSDGKIRYVGKGSKNRPWSFILRSKVWHETFIDKNPVVEIYKRDLTEIEAFDLEKKLISEIRISDENYLVNIADGGLGGNRYWAGKKRDPELMKQLVKASHTPKANKKRRIIRIENPYHHTEVWKEETSKRMNGYDFGPEHALKISDAKKGKPNGLLGRKIPEETKAKMSQAAMGRVYGKEVTDKANATKRARGNTTSKARAVRCKETGEIFRCAKEVSLKLFEGKGEKVIQQCCTGGKPSYKGYRFEYAV